MKRSKTILILSLAAGLIGTFSNNANVCARTVTFDEPGPLSNLQLLRPNRDFNVIVKGGEIIIKDDQMAHIKTASANEVAFIKSLANLPEVFYLEAEVENLNINKGEFTYGIYDNIFLGLDIGTEAEKTFKIGILFSEDKYFYIVYRDKGGILHYWDGDNWTDEKRKVSVGVKVSKKSTYRLVLLRDSNGYGCDIRDKTGKNLCRTAFVRFSEFNTEMAHGDYLGFGDLSEENNAGQISIRRLSLRPRRLDFEFSRSFPPKIDGDIEEVCWKRRYAAMTWDFFTPQTGLPAESKTIFLLTSDKKKLFIAWKCWSENMNKIKCDVKKRDGAVIEDECVELFLRPDSNYQKDIYHLIVNPAGVIYDALKKGEHSKEDSRWNAHVEIKTVIKDKVWLAEMGIPLEDFGVKRCIPGSIWQINIIRNDSVRKEKSQWIGIQGDYESYGELQGIEFYRVGINVESGKPVTILWRRAGYCRLWRKELGEIEQLKLTLEIHQKDGSCLYESKMIKNTFKKEVNMDYIAKGTEKKIRVLLLNPSDEEVLGSKTWIYQYPFH